MSVIIKVYERKQKRIDEFGSGIEKKEINIEKYVCAPETPPKPPPSPARARHVYVKRDPGVSFLDKISAQDPICALISAATPTPSIKNEGSDDSNTTVKYLDCTCAGFQNPSIDYCWDYSAAASTDELGSPKSFGVSRKALFGEAFQSGNLKASYSPDLEEIGNINTAQSHVIPGTDLNEKCGKKHDAELMNEEKPAECFKVFESVAILTPLPKKSGSKRPNNGIDDNGRTKKKPKRKKHRPKVDVERKLKRAPKKMQNLATRKCTRKKKETETETRKHVRTPRSKKSLKTVASPTPNGSSQQISITDQYHEQVAPKTENPLQVDDDQMAVVSNLDHDVHMGKLESTVQPDVDNTTLGPMVLLSNPNQLGLNLNHDFQSWTARATRSAGGYISRTAGCQYNSLQAYKRTFKVNSCLSNSRRIGPTVPKRCMKKRTKRRRRLNMFNTHFVGHQRRKRSKVFNRRADFTSIMEIPTCNQKPNFLPNKKVEIDDEFETSEDVKLVCSGQELTGLSWETKEAEKDAVTVALDQIAIADEQDFQIRVKLKEENREILKESCIEIGLSLEQSLSEGVQVVRDVKAQSCFETGPSASKSIEECKSKNCIPKQKLKLPDELIRRGLNIYDEEEERHVKTIKRATMHILSRLLQQLSINDRLHSGRPKQMAADRQKDEADLHSESLKTTSVSLVPYRSRGRQKQAIDRPKHEVDLDPESLRRWDQLMKIDDGSFRTEENQDKENDQWWEREKETFRGRIDLFTSRMHQILGDRRFKAWKGSVVDSVVGVFLTQNVSDNLSSSAYMSLAAKYPVPSTSDCDGRQVSVIIDDSRLIESSSMASIRSPSSGWRFNQYFVTEPEPEAQTDVNHGQLNLRDEMPIRFLNEVVPRQNGMLIPEPDVLNHVPQVLPAEMHTISLPNDGFSMMMRSACVETEMKNGREASKEAKKKSGLRGKKKSVKDIVPRHRNWESLGKMYSRSRSRDQMDSVDWEAVRQAESSEVASTIEGRGQQTIIAGRIKEFLNRVVELHQSINLEWLRYAPPEVVKEYLLEFTGLGLKSVECVRLLCLQHVAFPVDINVARIAVRLGWVPLKPLPGNLQFHLLEEFPILDTIQKHLWPRLCVLDHRTLYELHYHMITFGKVFCTKRNPKCHVCPMKAECRHFASAQASANLALPGPSKGSTVAKSIVTSSCFSFGNKNCVVKTPMLDNLFCNNKSIESDSHIHTCEPIVEEPKSPQEPDIEDFFKDELIDSEDEEIPFINLSQEELKFANGQNTSTPSSNMSQALVSVHANSFPVRKLKNVSSLRTEHQVYELPDNHELLVGLEKREPDDSPYLLAIWQPGETPNSSQPHERRCKSQGSEVVCDEKTCYDCETIREGKAGIVRGTILIPCRTALRGFFPLNGTYFQVNEVFADHKTSYDPIIVPRALLWNLRKRTVYIGATTSSIFRSGLSLEEIQQNFWTGFTCVRGLERGKGAPRPLAKRFHCSPSKMEKKRKRQGGGGDHEAKAITPIHPSLIIN